MNLRHIEIFHAVYVNGSVSAAARALNISQPSVSKTLRHAETLLGFELFQRTNSRLVPTEDAHALFGDVADIQERVRALREAGRNLRSGGGATLRISALPSLALGALPTAVARFMARRPDVRFDLQTVHHDDLLRKLYERETDIAIAAEVPRGAPLGKVWLGEGELVVLYRDADLPQAAQRIELPQLVGHPFITLAASGPIGQLFAQEQERLGIELQEVASARTFYIAAALVRAGVGLSVVDNFTAEASLADGLAMRPLKPSLTFDVHAMHLLDRPPSALASEFLGVLREVIEAP
ncbi:MULTISPECIES: LysR family transcriptional regulator [unclassified Sphingomonas]|uniref:LysR family transcriptional regulator n=1 Tax=unclassified Sphingomonas TaxID=196159 RepID=UPI0006F4AF40|nr:MULTISPECIES: LysR substrate-binding domain-containing protein [unclassified Sphingomonas]KQM59958.1 LysR family transcriptional regulator [Sphingomonas sp. Leaf16]KQN11356.1 LysR family transcriptional regulator [Sphingomonas sp. Leaf29]KQN18678.1 LysR family transcriptional regulator [Sphingomonas sp. Leaf32]